MGQFKGTPGVWSVEGDEFYDEHYNNIFDIVCFSNTTCAEDEANARLIAAAPELLDIVIHVKNCIENDGTYSPANLDYFHKAINKALGE